MSEQRAVIRLTDASVVFAGRDRDVCAVDRLHLEVERGTVFCLLGPNGSGKTSVINLLNGLLRPATGTVSVLGTDPVEDRHGVLSRIALVPQETALYEQLTGYGNLRFHADYYGVPIAVREDRVTRVLDLVGLRAAASDRVSSYSGGMRRRLMLGRALLTDPELVILDEPTLGVDVQSRQAIWARIRALADEGRTVFLTTNYMEEAEALGRSMMIIDSGVCVASGTPTELRDQVARPHLVLRFLDDASRDRVGERLSDGFGYRAADAELRVQPPDGEAPAVFLLEVLGRLHGMEGAVTGIELAEPSLQDVFLHYTGEDLRD